MIRLPTLYCLTPGLTSVAKFVPAYELPLLKRAFRGKSNPRDPQQRQGIQQAEMPSDIPAELRWHAFADPVREFGRLKGVYGQEAVDAVYPDESDFYAIIESELVKAAQRHGAQSNRDAVAPQDLVDLIGKAFPEIPLEYEKAPDPKMGDPEPRRKDIALALLGVGIVSMAQVARSTMTELCKARYISPSMAADLRETARHLIEEAEKPLPELTEAEKAEAEKRGEETRLKQEQELADFEQKAALAKLARLAKKPQPEKTEAAPLPTGSVALFAE